jgi:hypothetical protein
MAGKAQSEHIAIESGSGIAQVHSVDRDLYTLCGLSVVDQVIVYPTEAAIDCHFCKLVAIRPLVDAFTLRIN